MSETPENQGQPPTAEREAFWDQPIRQLPGEPLVFSTTLRSGDFLGISIVNGLLNIVTLTLYRFWGKTEVRRRVWRGLRLNGEAFEYTGRGVELFIGFLLAIAVLGVPFLAVVFAVQLVDPAWAVLLLPMYLFAFWLFGFGVFTAFRYMASRTTWRGVRFALKGSAQKYGWTFLGMTLLTGLTLGWTAPIMQRGLAGQIWGAMNFGDRRMRWSPERSEAIGLYGPFALGWFGTGVGYVLASIGFFGFMMATGAAGDLQGTQAGEMPPVFFMVAVYGYMALVAPLFLLIWAPYQSAVLRSIANGVSLDEARFSLDVGSISLWWLTCTNYLMLILSLGFLMPLIQARTAKYLAGRLRSSGTAQIEDARQAAQGPRTAEGLADAFGFSFI